MVTVLAENLRIRYDNIVYFVFEVSPSNNFRRLLDQADLSQFAVILLRVWYV